MYYVCSKRVKDLGVTYGIMDTEDGVIEYYSPKEVIRFVKDLGVSIEGVFNFDSKWHIKVLKPTEFEAVTQDYLEYDKQVTDVKCVSYNSSEFTSFRAIKDNVRSTISPILVDSELYDYSDDIYIQSDINYSATDIVDGETNYLNNPRFNLEFRTDYYFAVSVAEVVKYINGKVQNCLLRLGYNPIKDCLKLYTEGDFEYNFIKGLNKSILFEGTIVDFDKWISTLSDTKTISYYSEVLRTFRFMNIDLRPLIAPLLVDVDADYAKLSKPADDVSIYSDIDYTDTYNGIYSGGIANYLSSGDFILKYKTDYYFKVTVAVATRIIEGKVNHCCLRLSYNPIKDFVKLYTEGEFECSFIGGVDKSVVFSGTKDDFDKFMLSLNDKLLTEKSEVTSEFLSLFDLATSRFSMYFDGLNAEVTLSSNKGHGIFVVTKYGKDFVFDRDIPARSSFSVSKQSSKIRGNIVSKEGKYGGYWLFLSYSSKNGFELINECEELGFSNLHISGKEEIIEFLNTLHIPDNSNRNAPIFKFTDFTDYTAVPDASLRHVTTHSQELKDFINLIKTTQKIIKPLIVDGTLYSNPDEIYIQSDIRYSDNKNVYEGELSYFEASIDFDLKFMNSYYFSVPMIENETNELWLTYYPMNEFIKLACKEDSNCYFIKGFNSPIIFEGKLKLFKDFLSTLQR